MKTAERTIERPRVARPVPSDTKRRSMITPIAVVVAVLLGLITGFLVWGLGDTDSTEPVAVGGSELTARQEQMIDLLDDYVAAWRDGNGDAAAAMFTENGVFTISGSEYRVEGGAFADLVAGAPLPSLDALEPVLVGDTSLLYFHVIAGEGARSDVLDFTADGELLIISHEIGD